MYALKFLNDQDKGTHSGFEWPLPRDGKPGKWVSVKGEIEPCYNGIHACTLAQCFSWFTSNPYLIELGGKVIDNGNKLVARKGRLIRPLEFGDRELRLFAADCAERVLPIFEKERPDDDRPRTALAVARRFANGEATEQERDAAGAAAGAAARAAAWDAAGAAAWDAAGAAAWDAAGDAEREWQVERFSFYFTVPELMP